MTTVVDTDRHKGGRPPKSDDDLRKHKIKVGFTDLEFDTVSYKAQQAGRQPSNYIHDAALYAKVRSHINDEQVEQVRGLAMMGNNLNQIARQANRGNLPYIRWQCEAVVGNIGTLVTRILRGGDLSQ